MQIKISILDKIAILFFFVLLTIAILCICKKNLVFNDKKPINAFNAGNVETLRSDYSSNI